MVPRFCHLTTSTVLTERQSILTRVVYVSTVWAEYAEMSLNVQRLNKLIKFLLVTNHSVTVSLPVTLITTVSHYCGVHAGGLNDQITKQNLLTKRRIMAARGWWAAKVQGWTAYRNWWHVVVCNKSRVKPFIYHMTAFIWCQEGGQSGPACSKPQLAGTDNALCTGVP